MKPITAALLLLLSLAVPGWGQTPTVYRFGFFAAHMKAEVETAVITAATSPRERPWALFANWAPLNSEPDTLAFYPPHTSTDQIRRGVALAFRCRSDSMPRECLDWKPEGTTRHYVQITEKGAFTKALRPRTPNEKPILLGGTFSDRDLLGLVQHLRTNRTSSALSVCGSDPIWSIERKGKDVSVLFSTDLIGGCTATVRQTAGQWEVIQCGCWVS